MRANEIFRQISEEFRQEIVAYVAKEKAEIFLASMDALAIKRKMRPVFMRGKNTKDQIEWMLRIMPLRLSERETFQLIHAWLLGAKTPMLCDFLDNLGIERDDEGGVENMPDKVDDKKLEVAIDTLLQKHSRAHVALYLRLFSIQNQDAWANLSKLLKEREELALDFKEKPKNAAAKKKAAKKPVKKPAQKKPAQKKPTPKKKATKKA